MAYETVASAQLNTNNELNTPGLTASVVNLSIQFIAWYNLNSFEETSELYWFWSC